MHQYYEEELPQYHDDHPRFRPFGGHQRNDRTRILADLISRYGPALGRYALNAYWDSIQRNPSGWMGTMSSAALAKAYQYANSTIRPLTDDDGTDTGTPDDPNSMQLDSSQLTTTMRSSTSNYNKAKKRAASASGTTARDNKRMKDGIMPAMFMPGRGAGLPFINDNFGVPLKLDLKQGSGPELHGQMKPYVKLVNKPKPIVTGFGYKVIHSPTFAGESGAVQDGRFYTSNIFRHCNTHAFNSDYTYNTMLQWNNTLGPDTSYTRKEPPAGTWNGVGNGMDNTSTGGGLTTDLVQALRYPANGEDMWSRLNMVDIENLSWIANPTKICSNYDGSGGTLLNTQASPTLYYTNPAPVPWPQLPGEGPSIHSFPSQQGSIQNSQTGLRPTSNYKYCPEGSFGEIAYKFANDGTNPVVVDVVVVRVKKNQSVYALPGQPIADVISNGFSQNLVPLMGQAYVNKTVQDTSINFAGQVPVASDIFTNAKMEFMPAEFISSKWQTQQTDTVLTNDQGINQMQIKPYKFCARDQFIVPAGQLKPFKITLPRWSHDATDYVTMTYPSSEPESSVVANDYTYAVYLGFSGVFTPQMETGRGSDVVPANAQTSIINRDAGKVNMTVTGTYTERPKAAYCMAAKSDTYAQAVMQNAYSETLHTKPTFLNRINIADASQVTRSADNTTAQIEVGPFSTQSGA